MIVTALPESRINPNPAGPAADGPLIEKSFGRAAKSTRLSFRGALGDRPGIAIFAPQSLFNARDPARNVLVLRLRLAVLDDRLSQQPECSIPSPVFTVVRTIVRH